MSKNNKNIYTINISTLKLGKQSFHFDIQKEFFDNFAPDLIQDASVQIEVQITKTTQHLDTQFHIKGSLQLNCDRCLNPYWQPIQATIPVIYSFNSHLKDSDNDEVIYLSRETRMLDLSQEIYDFIALQIPQRKVPTDCPSPNCPPEILKMIQQNTEEIPTKVEIDPRWEKLKKITLN